MRKSNTDLPSAQAEAKRLIIENQVYELPVPIFDIAAREGLVFLEAQFEEQILVSGFFDLDQQQIILNSEEDAASQALTMARALGHWILHEEEIYEIPELQIVYLPSLGGTLKNYFEKEAMHFAVNLLVPPHFFDEDEGKPDSELAERYNVPEFVIKMIRLQRSGLKNSS